MDVLKRNLVAFIDDEDASLTVELVIWIPWLLFYLVFTTSAYLAMDSRLEAMRASITLTDIVSRYDANIETTNVTDLEAMFNALTPSATGERLVRITKIQWDSGNYVIDFGFCMGGIKPLVVEDLVDNPAIAAVMPPMADLATIFLVETYIPYTPVSEVFGLEPVVWANRKAVSIRFLPNIGAESGVDGMNCGTATVE